MYVFITSGNEAGHFHVTNSREITVSQPLDRETVPSYILEVTATDGLFVTTCQVIIEVMDVNGKCLFHFGVV